MSTQHAAALFGVGEAASGAAMAGAFADMMGRFTPLARSAEIRYLKPARGPITATAVTSGDPGELLSRLETDGKVEFDVDIELGDSAGVGVAGMTVSWHLRKNA